MSDNNDGGKKQSFWTTLPGILTGVAGVISSVAALVTAVNLVKPEPLTTTESPPETEPPTIADSSKNEDSENEDIVRKSCREHLNNSDNEIETGVYTIDPDGAGEADRFDVWCDMETDGGGWTLLAKSNLRAPNISGTPLTDQAWVDIFQNFAMKVGNNTVEVRENAAFAYSELYENEGDQAFFANIQALGTVPFSQVLLHDGKRKIIQYYAEDLDDETYISLKTLYEGAGISSLHEEKNERTGLILMLGKENKTNKDLCYYPDIETLKCDQAHIYVAPSGGKDTSNNTSAFYVGSLAGCDDATSVSVANSLWGSKDCYESNKAGGFGGFTIFRPYNSDANAGGSEGDGWISTGSFEEGGDRTWEIYIR
ncbi:MAG: fibrinogen-like YCDxxxxGGGW domain-containing protein [Cyanobacteria bacterium J06650_10]